MPSLYFIADSSFGMTRLPSIVETALQGGVGLVQLRCKNTPVHSQRQLAQQLKDMTEHFSAKLLINDSVELCTQIEAAGVHLGKEDTTPALARRLLGQDAIVGVTIHNKYEAEQADYDNINYVSLGPVFISSIKPELSPLGVHGLINLISIVRKHSPLPIFCIGGINLDNIIQLKEVPIDGVAIGSAIGGMARNAMDTAEICRFIYQTINCTDTVAGGDSNAISSAKGFI